MTVQELNSAFSGIVKDIQGGEMGNIMAQIGSDAILYINKRVTQSGVNAEGQKYAPYSTTPTLTNCSALLSSACSNIAGSKTKRRELKWVTIQKNGKNIRLFELPGGYKQYRELHNLQTGFVDFAFSNRMWNNIKLTSNNSDHNNGIAKISPTTELDNDKLAGNTERRGPILKLSDSEIKDLSGTLNKMIVDIIHKNGL